MQRRSARFTNDDDESTASIESIDRIEREIRRRNRTESVVEEVEEPEERNNMDGNQFGRFLREMQEANAQLAAALTRRAEGEREAEEEEEEQQTFNLKPYGRVLDTTTKRGSELYNQAIKAFESKYDGNEGTFHNFMSKVKQRAGHLMCGGIFNVEENGKTYNLFEDYSSITTEMAKGTAMNRWRINDWHKQGSYIMGMAMLDSLEDEFRARLLTYQDDYTIMENDVPCVDGPLVLKQITRLVQPETGYSGYTLMSELQGLKLENYGYDLLKLHEAMKNLILRIRATKDGRESVNDTMIRYILLDIYDSARCEDFKTFIQTKKDTQLPELVALMQQSEDKYRDLVKTGKWTETPKDELILALQAKTEQLTKENQALAREKRKRKEKKRSSKSSKRNKKRKTTKGGEEKDDEWMKVPPKPGQEGKIITKSGKEWAWCKFHNKWVVYKSRFGTHTSETCRLNPKLKDQKHEPKNKAKVSVDANNVNTETESGTDGTSSNSGSESDASSE